MQDKLTLGNLNAKRDWGYAPEYCEGMWRILQHDTPEDFVLATGKTNTVRDFVAESFMNLGVNIEWHGEEENENGIIKSVDIEKFDSLLKSSNYANNFSSKNINLKEGDVIVEVSPGYYRPTEVELLIGDPKKAKEKLGWEPKTELNQLIEIMIKSDLDFALKKGF